jgi:hypothetical protein
MKNTWFEKMMFKLECTNLSVAIQNEIVVCANRRLGLKICKLWTEDYDQLKSKYFEKLKA